MLEECFQFRASARKRHGQNFLAVWPVILVSQVDDFQITVGKIDDGTGFVDDNGEFIS